MADERESAGPGRAEMVRRQLRERGIHDERVLEVMGRLERERFVPPEQRAAAYEDRPLGIGGGQTISQPYIVALMTQELEVRRDHRVLEIGTGSGYQTAILAELAGEVCSVERIEELAAQARRVIEDLGLTNVRFHVGDGSLGWPDEAPFDRILCAAASPEVPPAWTEQLADNGRIIAPVGTVECQRLLRVHKRAGVYERRVVCDVRFVRLIGQQGWRPEEYREL